MPTLPLVGSRPRASRARAAAALLSGVVLAACGSAGVVPARPVDASVRDASPASADTAAVFAPGVISNARRQWRITFTPDGRTAYYGESDGFFPATREASIYVSHQVDGAWTTPRLAPFSGVYSDIDPFITPDGSRLYFSSIRPVDGVIRGDIDIWYVDRTADGWGPPVRLGPEVNGPSDELYPSASADGDLYFGVGPAGPTPASDWDIHVARREGRGFAPRQPVAAVNTDLPFSAADPTTDWEFNPEISPDGRTLVFASLRPGGHGHGDLYVSHLEEAGWSAPRNLGPRVNTPFDEFHPTLGRDGWLYFVRNAFGATHGDIHRIPMRAVGPLHRDGAGREPR